MPRYSDCFLLLFLLPFGAVKRFVVTIKKSWFQRPGDVELTHVGDVGNQSIDSDSTDHCKEGDPKKHGHIEHESVFIRTQFVGRTEPVR